MKSVFISLLLGLTIHVLAQDYSSIIPNSVTFYQEFGKNIRVVKAAKLDLAYSNNGIDTYKSFNSLYDYEQPKYDSCTSYVGPSWIGHKIEIESTGWNRFYNFNRESINIKTDAQLGDTFLVYKDSSDIRIFAEVDSIYTSNVFGVLDSVKRIQLYSYHPKYKFQLPNLELSKNHGFVKWLNPQFFPSNLLTENQTIIKIVGYRKGKNKFGLTRITKKELTNYNLGDEYLYVNNENFLGGQHVTFTRVVLNEEPSPGRFQTIIIESSDIEGSNADTSFGTLYQSQSNEPFHDYFPEELSAWYGSRPSGRIIRMDFPSGSGQEQSVNIDLPRASFHSHYCYDKNDYTLRLNLPSQERYKAGFGKIYEYIIRGPNRGESTLLIGFKMKDTISDNWHMHFPEIEPPEPPKKIIENIVVSPNPSDGELKISFPDLMASELFIYNMNGKMQFYKEMYTDIHIQNLSFLQQGVYLIEVRSEEEIKRIRWVKNP